MTTLTLDFPPDIYQRLHKEANRLGKSPQAIIVDWVEKQLPPSPGTERDRADQILKESGLLTELGPELRKRAERSTVTLPEVRAILDRVKARSLSEIVLAQRKEKYW